MNFFTRFFQTEPEASNVETTWEGKNVQANPSDSEKRARYVGRINRLRQKMASVPKGSQKYKDCQRSLKRYEALLTAVDIERSP